jgi:hypothetical protein
LITKAQQTRGKKEKPITKAKLRDMIRFMLDKAWKIQSEGIRQLGHCVGCGKTESLNAGHLVHGGRGKHHTRYIDFNVALPHDNVFCQCSWCNCGNNPDGNGQLKRYFLRTHTVDDYDELRLIKNTKMEVDRVEEAEWILAETIKRYK